MNDEIERLIRENKNLKEALIKNENEIEAYKQKLSLIMEVNDDLRKMIVAYQDDIQFLLSSIDKLLKELKGISQDIQGLQELIKEK